MDLKTKFIIIGLIIFSMVSFSLFMIASNQQQALLRESNDLKSENAAQLSKINQLTNDLKENQGKIESLKAERDEGAQALNELQKKFELASKARDELIEKLKDSQRQEKTNISQQPATPAVPAENSDAYWGAILKAKTDLELQLSDIRVELRNLQINNESLQREKSVLEIDVNSLMNEKKDLLRQLDYNQKILDSISQEVVRERNDKVKIQDSFKAIKSENNVYSRQLKSINNRKMALDKKVQDLQEGKSTIEKRLSEMETMLAERMSQINSLKEELDAVKSGKASLDPEKKARESVELPAIVVRSSPSTDREKAEVLEFPGKILAVNPDNNFVVIDLGTSAGVKVGDAFGVYRGGKSIGSIEVIQVRENISACDIKRMSGPLKISDNIK